MAGVSGIAEVEFEFDTTLSTPEVIRACERAAETHLRGGGGKFKELQRGRTESGAFAIHYAVLMGALSVSNAQLNVAWTEKAAGGCRGRMRVPRFTTTQQKALVFVPVSPKSVPALKALRRFAESLRVELVAGAQPIGTVGGSAPSSGYAAPAQAPAAPSPTSGFPPPAQSPAVPSPTSGFPPPAPSVAVPSPPSGYVAPAVTPDPGVSEPSTSIPEHPAGWYADPHGRHEHRYWDGEAWTAHVATAGSMASDPC